MKNGAPIDKIGLYNYGRSKRPEGERIKQVHDRPALQQIGVMALASADTASATAAAAAFPI